MVNPFIDDWMYTTMLIENEWGQYGTGFLVRRSISEDKEKTFLVTNKHVLGKRRQQSTKIRLHCNVKEAEQIKGYSLDYMWKLEDRDNVCKEHPDQDTDVAATHISSLRNQIPNLAIRIPDYSNFASSEILKNNDISIGDQALVIGYPLGLKHQTTNFPLVRTCMIATNIQETLQIKTKEDGVVRNRLIRGFIIDGGTSPGSSGSPIIYNPSTTRYRKDGGISIGPAGAAHLLGIVSEARLAIVESDIGDYPSLSGLTVAFNAETIRETIELFFQ